MKTMIFLNKTFAIINQFKGKYLNLIQLSNGHETHFLIIGEVEYNNNFTLQPIFKMTKSDNIFMKQIVFNLKNKDNESKCY